jgi:transposase-like protein
MDKFKWTPRKRRSAYMLACEPKKYTDIAKQLNITVQTLWNYRQHGEFNREVGKISARENRLRIETQIAISLRNLL